MGDILTQLIVGLVVTALTSIVVWLYRKNLLRKVQGVRQIYGDTFSVFRSDRDAHQDIYLECLRSTRIRFVGIGNYTFLKSPYPSETLLFRVLTERVVRKQEPLSVQFLHLSPTSRFLEIRAKEVNYQADEIRRDIVSSLRFSQEITRQLRLPNETVQIRHYDSQVLLRAVILDQCCFVGFYKLGRMGGFSPLVKVKCESELGMLAIRYFETLWLYFSRPAGEDLPTQDTDGLLSQHDLTG